MGNEYLLKLYAEEALDRKGREAISRAYTLKNDQSVQISAGKQAPPKAVFSPTWEA